jgi:hypothetical protein
VVDVAADEPLLGGTGGLFAGRSDAPLAQQDFRVGDIALGFDQSLLALHHARAGAFAQVFH